jgi:two-component system, OmpR family, sensor histidine kinase SaeS
VTEVAIFLALGTVAVGVAAAFALRLLPTVRLQLAGLALLAVVLPLSGVLASGWVMFHMHDDAKILAVSSAAALSAVAAALLLARWILQPLDRLRRTSEQLADGELGVRAEAEGPREFAEMGRSFNAMADSIERLFEARRELVAWASHDLRTPLASLQAMIEASEDGLVDPRDYLPSMHDRVRTLSMLVDDLFELARIDAGVLTLELREAQIGRVVESCVRGFEAEARAKRIQLQTKVEAPLPAVRCAPDKVERVLYNLLTNALRHTPSDGAIAVVVQPSGNVVTVAVEDSGEGIGAEATERMFDRFWRGESSRTGGNAGLGLAIARGLVEAQGGRIWAETRAEGGARVSFTLPAPAR